MDRRSAVLSALLDGTEEDFLQIVECLPDIERKTITEHYWQGKSWAVIESEMRYDKRYLLRRCAAALRQVEALIFPA